MKEEARQSRLLAFFNRLSGKDKDIVLKVAETMIEKENKDNNRDSSKANSNSKTCSKT